MLKNLIYDVGMNNGDDTAYYIAKGFRVIAIEANPLLVEQASRRFEQEISDGKLIILNIGVSDNEGMFPFYVCESFSEWSTFDASVVKDKSAAFHQINVSCLRFRSILQEHGVPHYLKLDIEGNELYCIRDLSESDLPEFISFEKTEMHSIDSLTLLHNVGYNGFKLISQFNYLPVQYPPTLEQQRFEKIKSILNSRNLFIRAIRKFGAGQWLKRQSNQTRYRPDWEFLQGSSGPFGEDTLGKWQTFEEIQETLKKANSSFYAREPSVFWGDATYSFWADFHVKRDV